MFRAVRARNIFIMLARVEEELGRTVSPTVYTADEFERRLRAGNPFLKRVLAEAHILLKGDMDVTEIPTG